MRFAIILAVGGVAAFPALGHSLPRAMTLPGDTTTRIRFELPARALGDALSDFSRQAGISIRLDQRAAANARSRPVAGLLTAPEALRQALDGTGLVARFSDEETVVVSRLALDDVPVTLSPLVVVGQGSRGYVALRTNTATRTNTPLRDTPQSVSVVTSGVIADQSMQGMADVVRYIPGITMGQGEGHRDAPTIRGNSSTADFFVDGMRDDAQYYRDLYNVERVEALKGSNAMTFGRGGGGGVLNRVTKEAQWARTTALTLEGGSFEHKRGTIDIGQGIGPSLALRFTGLYENSEAFRDASELERYGLNPTVAFALGARTTLRAGFEHFNDDRTVDRGVPSFQGRPFAADISNFFGNPDSSYASLRVNTGVVTVEHATRSGVTFRNRTRYTSYDKFYQNSFAGAINAAGTQVALSAYNNGTDRANLFNQTDVTYGFATGKLAHTLLIGGDVGRQKTENFRETGYYDDATTSSLTPLDRPTVSTPITFRQSATDADNHSTATVLGGFIQDQVEISRYLQAIAGVRFERFEIDFHNDRNDQNLNRSDDMISPRAGLVFKPVTAASLYGSYSVSYLPSSGDQFSSLSATSETLEPEQFTNAELGAKWDVRPSLALTAAVYRLDRTNTSAPDPQDPTITVQTGSQRTEGVEAGASGYITDSWQISGGVAFQRAEITSATSAAPEGRKLALVPGRTASLWNRFQIIPAIGVGLGIVSQTDMYAAIDNTVTLPGFTRADGALFVRLFPRAHLQLNVQNLLDERYYTTSHGNNNIMPGAPRTLRVSLTTRL